MAGLAHQVAANYEAAKARPDFRPAPVTLGHSDYRLGGTIHDLTAYNGALYASVLDLPARVGAMLNGGYFTGWSVKLNTVAEWRDGYLWHRTTLDHLALLIPGEVPAVKNMQRPVARWLDGSAVPPLTP
jgi:hypothetical protein